MRNCLYLLVAAGLFIISSCTQNHDCPTNKSCCSTDSLAKTAYAIEKGKKPSGAEVLEMLKSGNQRFISGKCVSPHSDSARIALANESNQADFAIATVLSCADSRVPVEKIFDAGIMDLFVVRVAGNVADSDEIGTMEYGVCHVKTPLLVVLGHTKCGAVTAVAHAVEGKGHELEANIPGLVDNIIPAVKKTMENHKELEPEKLIPLAIEENVYQSIFDLFLRSAAIRKAVADGKLMVAGAMYHLEDGKVSWLDQNKVTEILNEVEKNPKKSVQVFAESSSNKEQKNGH